MKEIEWLDKVQKNFKEGDKPQYDITYFLNLFNMTLRTWVQTPSANKLNMIEMALAQNAITRLQAIDILNSEGL